MSRKNIQLYLQQVAEYLKEISHSHLIQKSEMSIYIEVVYELLNNGRKACVNLINHEQVLHHPFGYKKTLNRINEQLMPFELDSASKQKLGLLLEGTELKKHSAMVYFPCLLSPEFLVLQIIP